MKSRLFYSQLFGILLLLLLILLVVPKYSKVIPFVLKEKVEKRLKSEHLNWVSVRVEDRDVTLSGISPTMEAHKKAIHLIEEMVEVRNLKDKISPMIIAPYSMNISYKGEKLHLKGYMPSKESKAILVKKLKTIYNSSFVDEIDIGSGNPKEWTTFTLMAVEQIKKFEFASLSMVDKEVHISGKIATENALLEVKEKLQIFEKQGYNVVFHIVAMDASAKICQEKFNRLLGKEKIEFQSNKSLIQAKNYQLLEELSEVALLCPAVNIEIIGHTDSLGDDDKNRALSLSRAKAVVAKLFELGVSLERMKAKGMGESEPIADNKTKEGQAKNRRIEFKVKGEK